VQQEATQATNKKESELVAQIVNVAVLSVASQDIADDRRASIAAA
jgi:hypothetical protein